MVYSCQEIVTAYMSPVKPESMVLPRVFNVWLENILATFSGCYSLSSQKGTTRILHLSKFANEPQDTEQNAWQTKAETALRHRFTIRSCDAIQEPKMNYGQYENEVHCPPASVCIN